MKYMQKENFSKIINIDKLIVLFWCVFLLMRLFIADSDNMSESYKAALIIPYIDANSTLIVLILSLGMTAFLLLWNKFKLDNNFVIFITRILLYFIPCIYVVGEFKWGIALAMFQTVLAYYIGLNYNGKINYIVKALIVASLILGAQIIAVLIMREISVFDTIQIKYYMRLPMGQTNTLGAFLVITYIIVDNFYLLSHKKIKYIYYIFLWICVCATGTRSGILVLILYYIYKFIKLIKSDVKLNSKKLRNIILIFVLISIVLFWLIVNYGDKIFAVISRFTFKGMSGDRFKVYAEVLEYIIQNPIFGRSAYYYYAYDAVKAHNFILESLIQTGIIGTVLYLLILINVYRTINKLKNAQLKRTFKLFVIFYLIHGMVEPNLFSFSSDTFFWFIVGIGAGCYYKQRRNSIRQNNNILMTGKNALRTI